jgi:hypothetical protein
MGKAQNKHYKNNVEYYRSRDNKRRDGFKQIIREAKDQPCIRCHRKFHFSAMEFHHRGDKKFEIADLPCISSEKKLREEMAKCDIICSNCHKIITWIKVTDSPSPDGL